MKKVSNSNIINNPVVAGLKESVSEYKNYMNIDVHKRSIEAHGSNIASIKNQTPELCLLAVQKDGSCLEYVREQTDEICLAAVKEYGLALACVENQTEKLCLLAVSLNGLALEFVQYQTYEICKAAFDNTKDSRHFINEEFRIYEEIQTRRTLYKRI